jgi:hypothetical protein
VSISAVSASVARAVAGDTIAAIIAVEDKVDLLKAQLADVQQKLSDLINQRSCESTNQAASIHHTVNHMHRMMLIPEGQRPGGCRKHGVTMQAVL